MTESVTNSDILRHLGKIEGQVSQLLQMMQANHLATNQRLDDMRSAINSRIDGHEKRIDKLETNERGTALKSSASGAITAAVVSATVAIAKYFGGGQ